MCLIVNTNKEGQFVDKLIENDLVVYKFMKRRYLIDWPVPLFPVLTSPYYFKKLKPGKLYKSRLNIELIPDCGDHIYSIEEGFHSLASKEDAINFARWHSNLFVDYGSSSDFVAVECRIPANSVVCKGSFSENFENYESYTSNAIIIDRVILR